jgi:hypothetical protein
MILDHEYHMYPCVLASLSRTLLSGLFIWTPNKVSYWSLCLSAFLLLPGQWHHLHRFGCSTRNSYTRRRSLLGVAKNSYGIPRLTERSTGACRLQVHRVAVQRHFDPVHSSGQSLFRPTIAQSLYFQCFGPSTSLRVCNPGELVAARSRARGKLIFSQLFLRDVRRKLVIRRIGSFCLSELFQIFCW